EDATNQDLSFARNRVRHELLPLLERDFNPLVTERLAETAELARAEQEYWDTEVRRSWVQLAALRSEGGEWVGPLPIQFDFSRYANMPLAVQRRIMHSLARICVLDFHHVEQLRLAALSSDRAGHEVDLPGGYSIRFGQRELWIEQRCQTSKAESPSARQQCQQQGYEHRLPVPGAVHVPELG